MTFLEVLIDGVLFLCGCWVLFACVKRSWMLPWRQHDPLVRIAYLLIGLSALTYVLPIPDNTWLQLRLFGIVGIAFLFWSGRHRWLKEAPPETARSPR